MTQWLCRTLVAAIVAATASGCTLYFGDDSADDCQFGFGADQAGGQRNPETNQCEFIGGGGGGGCNFPASDDDRAEALDPIANDWAECFTSCEALDETQCFAADLCRATYLQCPPGADCFRQFSGCVGIAPSGPATGEVCQGLDAYGCSRHNDCISIYGTTDLPNDGYNGTGVFIGCDAEPTSQGCFSDNECPTGFECTVDQGECSPPPGCGFDSDTPCPDVCFGHCVPSAGLCAAVDCGPGFHCEEVCPDTGDSGNSMDEAGVPIDPGECQVTCVPDQNFCPIECPPNSMCAEVCPPCNYPGDPSCNDSACHYECQEQQGGACENFDCGFGSHCEEECLLCDGPGCEDACQPFCVPNGPDACDVTTCGPGDHCEVQCTPSNPMDPNHGMSECTATCVPDQGEGCALIDCQVGSHCLETCAATPCMDPAGCPELCRGECVPDGPGDCEGVVLCNAAPPPCAFGTRPGVANGCWTGYCIPDNQCGDPPPPACEEETSEMSCQGRPECTPIYTGTCWLNPDNTYTCIDTQFVRCESRLNAMPF